MYFISMMQSWIFSIITPVFSVMWFYMLIFCSRNIYHFYQCWKLLIFFMKIMIHF